MTTMLRFFSVNKPLFLCSLFLGLMTWVLGCGGSEVTDQSSAIEGLPQAGIVLAGTGPFSVFGAASSISIVTDGSGNFTATSSTFLENSDTLELSGSFTYTPDVAFAKGEMVLTFNESINFDEGASSTAVMTITLTLVDPENFEGQYEGTYDEVFTAANGSVTNFTEVVASGIFLSR